MSRFSSRKVSEEGAGASRCSKSPWLRVHLECSWEVGGRGGGKGGGGYRDFSMDLDRRVEKEKREGR